MLNELSSSELGKWKAYFKLKRRYEEEEQKKAETKSKSRSRLKGINTFG